MHSVQVFKTCQVYYLEWVILCDSIRLNRPFFSDALHWARLLGWDTWSAIEFESDIEWLTFLKMLIQVATNGGRVWERTTWPVCIVRLSNCPKGVFLDIRAANRFGLRDNATARTARDEARYNNSWHRHHIFCPAKYFCWQGAARAVDVNICRRSSGRVLLWDGRPDHFLWTHCNEFECVHWQSTLRWDIFS